MPCYISRTRPHAAFERSIGIAAAVFLAAMGTGVSLLVTGTDVDLNGVSIAVGAPDEPRDAEATAARGDGTARHPADPESDSRSDPVAQSYTDTHRRTDTGAGRRLHLHPDAHCERLVAIAAIAVVHEPCVGGW